MIISKVKVTLFSIILFCLLLSYVIQVNNKKKIRTNLASIDLNKIEYIEITTGEETVSCYDNNSLSTFKILLEKLLSNEDNKSIITRGKREYYYVSFKKDTSLLVFDFGFPEDNSYLYLCCHINNEIFSLAYQLPPNEIIEFRNYFQILTKNMS